VRSIAPRGLAAAAVVLGLLAAAEPGSAATRYAKVGGSTSDPNCTSPTPGCTLQHALTVTNNGDEILVGPGNHVGNYLPQDAITMRGADGQPRPTLTSTSPLDEVLDVPGGTPCTFRHLELVDDGPAAIRAASSIVVQDVVVRLNANFDPGIVAFSQQSVIRDSLIVATGKDSRAIQLNSNSGVADFQIRNVTAIAHGTGAQAIRASIGTVDSANVVVKNTIARGDGADLVAESPGPSFAKITVSNSNYRAGSVVQTGPGGSVVDAGGNQTAAEPLFVNAAGGDYHELLGSPTIDGGTIDVFTGPLDLDGRPRSLGLAPDIGAYELPPLPVTPPDTTAPSLALSRVPKRITRRRLLRGLRVTVTPSEPAALLAELQGRARGATIALAYNLTLVRRKLPLQAGKRRLVLRPNRKLVGRSRRFSVRLSLVATDAAGNRRELRRTIRVRR
jgi:hypothetical protein